MECGAVTLPRLSFSFCQSLSRPSSTVLFSLQCCLSSRQLQTLLPDTHMPDSWVIHWVAHACRAYSLSFWLSLYSTFAEVSINSQDWRPVGARGHSLGWKGIGADFYKRPWGRDFPSPSLTPCVSPLLPFYPPSSLFPPSFLPHAWASTPYKRWSKCSMEKVRGRFLQPFSRG